MIKKTRAYYFLSLICFTLAAQQCHSLPSNPEVASGRAEIIKLDSRVMEVRPSDQAIINYSQFDIGQNEKVRFIQKSSSSCVLNRVNGKNPSEILGSLESNGKVFLVNSNGIYFGPNSTVNVGSLVASTLDIADTDFLQENYSFSLNQKGSQIRNEGLIDSVEGSIVLLSSKIQNLGSITARAGTVALASAEHVTLDFVGDGLIQFSVEGALKESLIEHLGEIKASTVSLKMPVAKKAISEIVNLDGIEEGDIFIEENGVIKFASSSLVEAKKVLLEAANLDVKGSIDARSFEDIGGGVHLFGRDISLDGALIDASGSLGGGEVLIGGEYQGKGKTPWASKVNMNESSKILVNAIDKGNGGLAVLWSKDQTIFKGFIASQGGRFQGNGGLIETSSQILLESSGQGKAGAFKGEPGTWLLDPNYLYVQQGNPAWASCNNIESSCDACYSESGWAYPDCSDSSNLSISPTFKNCETTVVLQASKAIYVQGEIDSTNSIIFQPCTSGFALPVFLKKNIKTDGKSVQFLNGAIPVIDTSDFFINTTYDNHHNGGEVIMNNIQATNREYGVSFFTVNGSGHTGSVVTMSTTTENGSVVGNDGAVTTYPPGSVSATCAYLETTGITTSGGSINVTANNTDKTIVVLGSNTVLSSPSGTIAASRVNPDSLGAQDIMMTASGGTISVDHIGDYKAFKNVSIEGSSLDVRSITTQGGTVEVIDGILGDNLTVDTTNGGISPKGANITINSLHDGNYYVNLNAGTSGAVSISNMTAVGAVTISGATCSFGNLTTKSGLITINSPVNLTTNGEISTTASGSGANIVINGTVNGTSASSGLRSFTAELGVGSLTVGTIGGAETPSSIKSVTITGSGDFDLPTIFVNGGNLTITAPVKLSADRTLTYQTTATTSYAVISLDQVDNDFNLTLAAAPAVATLGTVGATTPLNEIIIDAGSVNFNGDLIINQDLNVTNSLILAVNASLDVGGDFIQNGEGSVFLNGSITANNISIVSDVLLQASTMELTSRVGDISCGLGVRGLDAVTISSTFEVNAASSFSILNQLDQNMLSLTSNLSAGTYISIGGEVICDTLDATASGGNILFSSSVEAETFTATSTVGSVFIGDNLDIFSGLITAQAVVTIGADLTGTYCSITATTGDITVGNDVNLKQDLTLLASAGSISVLNDLIAGDTSIIATSGSVNVGDNLTARDLVVTAGNGITVSGNVEIDTGVISATGGNVSLGQVLSNGSISATISNGSLSTKNFYSGDCTLSVGGYISILGSLSTEDLTVTDFNGAYIAGQTLTSNASITGGSGSFVFQGTVTLGSLSTASDNYGVVIQNGGVINSSVNFLNTGDVSLNSGAYGSLLFVGALENSSGLTTILGGVGSQVGGITLDDATFLSGTSSLLANGFPILIGGTTTLEGNSTISSLSAGIHFVGTVEGPGALTVVSGEGEVTFDSSVGAGTLLGSLICTNIRRAHVKGTTVKAEGWVNVSADITISNPQSIISSNLGLILGDINGTTLGEESLTIKGGPLGSVLGQIGNLVPVGNVLIENSEFAYIQNITSRGTISITGSTILSSLTKLDTTAGPTWGYDVTLNTIEGTSSGTEGLIINAGSMGVVSLNGNIGAVKPLASMDITSFSTFFGSNLVTVLESQSYKTPVIMKNDCVFTTAGNITFESTLNAYEDTSFLALYMGNGAATFLGEVGGSYMGNLSIYNADFLSTNELSASSLRVSGGLPTVTLNETVNLLGPYGIFIDGGPINLGGEINAAHVFLRTSTTLVNLDEPQPINVYGNTPLSFQYINALGGNIGSLSSPIELNTTTQSTLGANTRADLVGDPDHSFFFLDRQNPPCIITFNGVTLIDCNNVGTIEQILATVPKNLFYDTWAYSSWNNLSNEEFFLPPAAYPNENPNKEKFYYINSTKREAARQLKKRI
jgi:filamentous hemagglutinin family protein